MTRLSGEALRQRCIESVVEEGERVGILAHELAAGLAPAPGGLGVQVPWIPSWTAADLMGHLGTVHRWASAIVRAGHTERPPPEAATSPPTDGLLEWYAAGLAALVATLRSTRPDAPAWHMSPSAEKVAASWARRQAHELLVHRCDLESAAGVPHAAVDPALAEDGVDELLTVVLPRWRHTAPLSTADGSVAVTGSDTGRTWSLRVVHGVVTIATDHTGREDTHLLAPVHELLLHLWGRPAEVTVHGDPAVEALLRGR